MKKIVMLFLLVLLIVSISLIAGCESKPKCRTITRTNPGCDKMADCTCLHNSWGGLGACDSCECTVCE